LTTLSDESVSRLLGFGAGVRQFSLATETSFGSVWERTQCLSGATPREQRATARFYSQHAEPEHRHGLHARPHVTFPAHHGETAARTRHRSSPHALSLAAPRSARANTRKAAAKPLLSRGVPRPATAPARLATPPPRCATGYPPHASASHALQVRAHAVQLFHHRRRAVRHAPPFSANVPHVRVHDE
jgi:hypothetical protein